MKRHLMMLTAMIVAFSAWAQKIDFGIAGKTSQALQEGYTEWVVPE